MEREARMMGGQGGGEPGWVGERAAGEREGVGRVSSLLVHGSLVPRSELLHAKRPIWTILSW